MLKWEKPARERIAGALCRALLLLTAFAAGGSVSRMYFGAAECIRPEGLGELAVVLCGFFGAFAAPVFLRITGLNRFLPSLAGFLASFLMLAAPGFNRVMLVGPGLAAMTGALLIAAATGFSVMLLIFAARRRNLLRSFCAAAALGGLLKFATYEFVLPLPDTLLFTACCLLSVILSGVLMTVLQKSFFRTGVLFTVLAAAGALYLTAAQSAPPRRSDLLFTFDGYRRVRPDADGTESFYTLDGRKTAIAPRDQDMATALLPAALQTPNHNQQVLLAASPLSQLIPEALRIPRIAGVDHLTGDPELAAVNQARMITRADVRRIGRFALLDGPYDLIVAAEGDPLSYLALLSQGGVLAVPPELSFAIPEGTFRYSGTVPGAEELILYSNRPLTTSWPELEETFERYDGRIRKFPVGVLAMLYELNRDREGTFEGLSGIEVLPRPETPPQAQLRLLFTDHPAIAIFLGVLALLLGFWRISAERRRYSSEFRRCLLSGLTVSGCVLAALGAIEALDGPLILHGYALLFPMAGLLFFPNGLSSDGVIRRMAAPVAAFLAVFAGLHPTAGMVGAFLFGCLNTTRERFRSCAAGFSGEIASGAGALIGIAAAMLLTPLPAGWIVWLVFFIILF